MSRDDRRQALLDRGEFLKLAGLWSMGLAVPPLSWKAFKAQGDPDQKNVLVIVYDAWTAYQVSLYGYPRKTMPNLNRLSDQAIVYHNHISAGNFTSPGTASLLTGVYPWTHRAFKPNSQVIPSFLDKNIFQAFSDYHRMAYTHNVLANTLLVQLSGSIDQLTPHDELFFLYHKTFSQVFKSDPDVAEVSWVRAFEDSDQSTVYSLFLSHLYEVVNKKNLQVLEKYKKDFPLGVPNVQRDYFIFEDGTDYVRDRLLAAPQPFFGYYHFYPPHAPYSTRREYVGKFDDNYVPVQKPRHIFNKGRAWERTLYQRQNYDEYLLYVDHEFGRLFDSLERSGLLENTWLVLTSDHGEYFERGIIGHSTPAMHHPILRVPLMIFAPGSRVRQDVLSPTSSLDLLPTLLSLTGHEIPLWCEGQVLPPFTPVSKDRGLYSMYIPLADQDSQISTSSVVLVREPYKLILYSGYEEVEDLGGEYIELYDIYEDPEELQNLYPGEQKLALRMVDEIKTQLEEVNARTRG